MPAFAGIVAAALLPAVTPALAATTSAWPGSPSVANADDDGTLGRNISGLVHDAVGDGVLWAVRDDPSQLLRLVHSGDRWRPAPGWGDGRKLQGSPDAEAVTVAASDPGGVYVGAERDNDAPSVSRNRVVRYDYGGTGTLQATRSWDLTSLLPRVGANEGIEGLAWLPDTVAVAGGLVDQRTGRTYEPSTYAGHGGGLFVVGLEATGQLFAFALSDSGSASLVATAASGLPAVMEVTYDAVHGVLWAVCDDTCQGKLTALVVQGGVLTPVATVQPPDAVRDRNDEGFAVDSTRPCDGAMSVVWSDDAGTDGHALRTTTLPCTLSLGAATGTAGSATTPASSLASGTTATGGGGATTTMVSMAGDGGGGGGATAVVLAGVVAAVAIAAAVVAAARRRR